MTSDQLEQLKEYNQKRDFSITSEPQHANTTKSSKNLRFVIQKHWATRLHYDFRLELNGTLKSWAVPKGPSFDPTVKRLAVQVEDHPLSYAEFEGTIPQNQYGAGKVIVWDEGSWIPIGDPEKAYKAGNLKFQLCGQKLVGHWALVRIKGNGDKQQPWLLVKEKDKFARKESDFDVAKELPDSVKSSPKPDLKNDLRIRENLNTKQVNSTEDILKESGAVKSKLPATFQPQLATLVDSKTVLDKNWIYEIKFDGYRILVRVEGKKIQLFSRNWIEWTDQLKGLVTILKKMDLPSGFYDGELVVNDDKGIPSFGLLQKAFEESATQKAIMYLFDMPFYNGMDLRKVPLVMRKMVLGNLLSQATSSRIKFSEHYETSGKNLLDSACKLKLEGIIAKQSQSAYSSGRSSNWLKLKCTNNQEFIVVGYTKPLAGRKHFGALMLGVYDDGKLIHVGNVGSGFTGKELLKLKEQLDTLQVDKNGIQHPEKVVNVGQWVKPEIVVEVTFSEWTSDGKLRQPVYKGIRLDKKPTEILKESPQHVDAKNMDFKNMDPKDSNQDMPHINTSTQQKAPISHPERVIDDTGITKLDLFNYYKLVGDLFFPHLKQRPVALLRAPEGIAKEMFFQKHTGNHKIKGFSEIIIDDDKQARIEVVSKSGICNAVQMNVIEFHTENNLSDAINMPNRIVFDLDPGEGLSWKKMQEATLLLHQFLNEISLPSFIKTSGGKGFHLVIPIKPKYEWETIKTLSEIIAKHVAANLPALFVAISGPRNRKGKIFIDYLRNGSGSTTVSAWSARARSGIGISVPIHVEEVMEINSGDHWTIKNVESRLDVGNDPWKDYQSAAINIDSTLKYFIKKE